MSEPDCYVGRLPCGCLVAWASMRLPPKDLAEVLKEYVLAGYTVEQANTDAIRSQLGRCKHREEAQGKLRRLKLTNP